MTTTRDLNTVPAPSASLSLDGAKKPGGGDFPTGGAT